jgi:hypothetical protein
LTHVVRDEVVGPLDDPGEVADAQLAALRERRRDQQPGRIAERLRRRGGRRGIIDAEPTVTKLLRPRQVETEQIAAVLAHAPTS